LVYGALFVVSGACLLTITYLLILHYSPAAFVTVQARTEAPSHTTAGGQLGGAPPTRGQPTGASVVHWTGLGHMLIVSGIALAIMAVISVIVGWFVAGRMLRPLRTMTVTARRISERNLHERLAVQGPSDELKDLGDTMDGLLGRLETVVDAQRQFTANASHELRTPLTLERTLLESALTHPDPSPELWRSTCERVLASGEKQARLIEALLVLAGSQQDLDHRETFDLASIAAAITRAHDQDVTTGGLTLDTTFESCFVSGDVRLVERLVSNLLQNAVRHNIKYGQVSVVVGARAGQASLRVTNTGLPIPAAQIHRLLRPFQRLGRQRSGEHDGLGLGLSIVSAIAQVHNATLTARPGPDGGLDIEVCFPEPPATTNAGNRTQASTRTYLASTAARSAR
jgi:signal transduction histidine kinase